MDTFFAANRANWDERADIHAEDVTGAYAIERFLAGEDVLFPIEAAEIGEIAGCNLLHLQCHIGIDTLCLVRRGARATGIDFSPQALAHARMLAGKSGLEARFVEGNVYHAPGIAGVDFDMVYTTWGTIVWLPDIRGWAKVVAACLRPGGRLYYADTHPSLAVLEEVGGKLEPTFNFRTPSTVPLEFAAGPTYTGDPRVLTRPSFEWIHPMSDILNALIEAGLSVSWVHEHEALPFRIFPMMVQGDDRLWRLPKGVPRLPLSLTLEAVKPG
jgi:SAM-dependent methyltransferase